MQTRPPRTAERLIALALGRDHERDMVLGDLHEEYVRRSARQSADAWYWRQALSVGVHALVRRDRSGAAPYRSGDFFMRIFLKDVKYAWRSLLKRPLLAVTVATTLAFGLGANAAIFNLIDRMVLRPFPLADPDHTVLLSETGPRLDYGNKETVSPANFLDWRTSVGTLTHLSGIQWWDASLLERGNPERLQGFQVSSGFFDALGMRPALGRGFVRDDETFGRHRVAVLSDALWKRRFGADPTVVGRSITIDGEPYQVIGIGPPRFAFPDGSEIWAPLAFDPKQAPRRDVRYLTVIGRLHSGKSVEDAQTEIAVIADRLAREYPDANRDHGARALTLTRGMLDQGTGPILALWQASALVVLLIACANIVNLMLARTAERRRETAVRLALGASRGRVIRELLTESTLLALLAVPLAIAFAWVALHLIRISMPARILRFVPGFEMLGPDSRLLAFTTGLALLTALVFGVLPALQAARSRVSEALKDGGRTTGRQVLRRAIVVAEMSIALPLLVAAGLGVIGTNRFLNGPQGYDPNGLLTMKLVLPERTYADDAARRRFVERAMDTLGSVPGVEHAAAVNNLPAAGSNSSRKIEIDGRPPVDPKDPPVVDNRVTTTDYFTTMRIPMVRGRAFTNADREGSAPVAIVSESMANKYWPGEDPVGRRLRIGDGPWISVVGICGDVIQDWFDKRNAPTLYRPIQQAPSDYLGIVVRAGGDTAAIAPAVRQALLRVDSTQPVFEMMSMRVQLKERTIGLQYLAAIMTVFAGLALLLAVVGLYAVMAYMVTQRRHEIGVRMALGASPRDVVRLTVGQAARLTAIGAAIGFALSIALGRLMQAGLLGIASNDGRVTVIFGLILAASALVASYLPARRAAAIDPLVALRTE
jgi:putative ABC transport system permease protein